jgi:serine/threonine-protein kinase
LNCPACSTEIADDSRFCSSCGTSIAELSAEATRDRTPSHESTPPSSDSHHGRFGPGTILAGRYRIIERIGKGGMGEVYRADDLMLDNVVALKFLPVELTRNAESLKRFRGEVAVARQISHPNVCRVYDISESEGHHFLSMEHIDGEDLRSLLRRIGRLPPDKAVEIAAQLASGLAAAHDKKVLHRDIKPANVMIDERGQARITDFGLAIAEGDIETRDIRSGTPGYMAPEQWAGKEVTERSDIYCLGLVLYEIFTGKRAFAARDKKGLSHQPGDETLEPPSKFIERLDPAVDRIILQCLEREPENRPPSATAVRAAFPGGDPLALAVARGETPAPALIAETGVFTGLTPAVALTCLVAAVVSIIGTIWVAEQTRLSQIIPLPKSPEVLVADARAILDKLGYPTPQQDSTFGFLRDVSYIDHLMSEPRTTTWWDQLARGEPNVIRFWYRESPQYLVPHRITEFFPTERDPPITVPGMVSLQLDARGRLRQLEAVSIDRKESDTDSSEVVWESLFEVAQLDIADFSPVEPQWSPPSYADRRAAWTGTYPDAPEVPIRIEAASYRSRLVAFRIIEPWREPAVISADWVRPSDVVPSTLARLVHVGFHSLFVLVLAFLAWRNLHLRRGDRRLAFRLACFFFAVVMLHWLFGAHHIPEQSQLQVFFGGLYRAFFASGLAWLFYMALEPSVRKIWPRTMVSWIRLLDGRFRDPRVGRDVLVGCVFGMGYVFLSNLSQLIPGWLGEIPPRPDLPRHPAEFIALRGMSESLSEFFAIVVNISTHILFLFIALLLLRLLLRKTWLAVGIHWMLYSLVYASAFPMGYLTIPMFIALWYFFFFRFGWVTILATTLTADLLEGYPLTTDLSAWYAYATILIIVFCLALTIYGFKVSLAGRPVLRNLLVEE